jgi:hypothetical protein
MSLNNFIQILKRLRQMFKLDQTVSRLFKPRSTIYRMAGCNFHSIALDLKMLCFCDQGDYNVNSLNTPEV